MWSGTLALILWALYTLTHCVESPLVGGLLNHVEDGHGFPAGAVAIPMVRVGTSSANALATSAGAENVPHCQLVKLPVMGEMPQANKNGE